jgi:HlyD family secretion protein
VKKRIAIGVVVAALVGGFAWWRARPRPIAVAVAEVTVGRVEATVANTRAGTIEAWRRAKLAPTVSGQVVALPVKKGSRVKAGDLLLALRNDDLQAELAAAESRSRAAQARADQACALARVSERDAQRARQLGQRGVAPTADVDRAVADARAQSAACAAARAEVKQAADSVAVDRVALDRTRLVAPFDGVVAEVNAELGEIVAPSPPGIPTPPAVDLIDDSELHVTAPIDEVDAPKVRLGMPVRVTVDAFPGRTFAGKVTRIAPYVLDVEKQARTVEIDVTFTDPSEAARLLPGYTADTEVIVAAKDDVLRVPTEAVVEGGRVWVLRPDGTLELRDVKTGLANWELTEVTAGLRAGERVVTSVNRPGLKAGAKAIAEPAK